MLSADSANACCSCGLSSPDKVNTLPPNWKAILRSWVSGEEVSKIGPQNMRAVEDAFTYRLVWARSRPHPAHVLRLVAGYGGGAAAAAVETGVPSS